MNTGVRTSFFSRAFNTAVSPGGARVARTGPPTGAGTLIQDEIPFPRARPEYVAGFLRGVPCELARGMRPPGLF